MMSRNFTVRLACLYYFCLEGVYNGVLSSYLPALQERLDLSDNDLGFAMLFCYLGQVLATPGAGVMMRRWGCAVAAVTGALSFACALPLVALPNNITMLSVTLLYFGVSQGLMDCTMNSCAILAEAVAKYPILGSFHGSYSVAAGIGAFAGTAILAATWSDKNVYVVMAIVSFVFAIVAGCYLYTHQEERDITEMVAIAEAESEKRQREALSLHPNNDKSNNVDLDDDSFSGYDHSYHSVMSADPRGSIIDDGGNINIQKHGTDAISFGIGFLSVGKGKCSCLTKILMVPQSRPIAYLSMLGFLAAFTESALCTWLIVFYKRYFSHAPSHVMSSGFVLFQVCMGLGRYTTDLLRGSFGSRKVIKVGGVLVTCGVSLLCLSPKWTRSTGGTSFSEDIICAGAGSCLIGLGLSTWIPISFSSAGYIGHSGTSVATVGCWMYAGGILSSPLLGAVSSATSLQGAMVVLACCTSLVIPLGFVIPIDRYTKRMDRDGNVTTGTGDSGSLLEGFDEGGVDDLHAPLIV